MSLLQKVRKNLGAFIAGTPRSATRSALDARLEALRTGEVKATVIRGIAHFGPNLGCDFTKPPVARPGQGAKI